MIVQGLHLQHSARFWVKNNFESNVTGRIDPIGLIASKKELVLNNGEKIALLFEIDGLDDNTEYTFSLVDGNGEVIEAVNFFTLPENLNQIDELYIAAGSCYWLYSYSRKLIFQNYPPKGISKPRIRFLMGDQIYNDMFGPSESAVLYTPETYINYKHQWDDDNFINFITQSPNAVLADDHEFWNNYPHYSLQLAAWQNDLNKVEVERVEKESIDALNNYQLTLNPNSSKSFSFDVSPLSFYVLDTRIDRTHYETHNTPHFIEDKVSLLKWINTLTGPGVLVISGLIVDKTANFWTEVLRAGDFGLPDYGDDYYDLWLAMKKTQHDILIIGGDVHYGRFGYVEVPSRNQNFNGNGRIYECITSALCLLESAKSSYSNINKFDISGSLERNNNLQYNKLFNTARGVSNYATISFKNLANGVEFEVNYYGSDSGKKLNGEKLINNKFILY